MLDQVRTSADPRALLVELLLERLAAEDASLSEVARLAAIPRWLDSGVIAALRGGDPDPGRDALLLARLMEMDLVDGGRATRPAYHDSVRTVLLAQLRKDPAWRPRFE